MLSALYFRAKCVPESFSVISGTQLLKTARLQFRARSKHSTGYYSTGSTPGATAGILAHYWGREFAVSDRTQISPAQLSSAQLRSEEPVLGVNFTATRTSLSNLPDARLKNISASVAEVARSVVFLFPPCCKLINILFVFLSRFFSPHENKFWLRAAFKTKQTSVMEF